MLCLPMLRHVFAQANPAMDTPSTNTSNLNFDVELAPASAISASPSPVRSPGRLRRSITDASRPPAWSEQSFANGRRARCWRVWLEAEASAVLVIQVGLTGARCYWQPDPGQVFAVHVTVCVTWMGVVNYLLFHSWVKESSRLVLQVRLSMLLGVAVGWAFGAIAFYWWALKRKMVSHHPLLVLLVPLLKSVHAYVSASAIQTRLALVESFFGQNLGTLPLKWVRFAALAVVAVCFVLMQTGTTGKGPYLNSLWEGAELLSWTVAGFTAWRGLSRVCAAVRPLMSKSGHVKAEAVWAWRVADRARTAVAIECVCGAVNQALLVGAKLLLALAWDGLCCNQDIPWVRDLTLKCMELTSDYAFVGFAILASVVQPLTVCFMVGVFQVLRPEVSSAAALLKTPAQTISIGTRSDAWDRTVSELASRSVDVAGLLDLYQQLGPTGKVMPDYEPWQHTTADIVRRAIIPLTTYGEGQGSAYAQHGAKPEVMVSHSWSNLFLHLVAAVVADALGMDTYKAVSLKLVTPAGIAVLREQLREYGTLGQRYWICALCVNQHASICGGFPPPPALGTEAHTRWDASCRDTVSGFVYPLCTCQETKYLNDSPDRCELNKFDDMLALLYGEVPGFRLVGAVDKDFEMFTRIWCLAELLQCFSSGIPQKLCILSNKVFDPAVDDQAIYRKLIRLSVNKCEASRAADKEAILAKISDPVEVDAQLQALIFSGRGLLGHKFSGFDILTAAASSARRLASMSSEKSDCFES